MMGRFFVVSALMMLSCFAVVTRGMRMVLCRLLMVLGCFLGHSGVSSVWWARNTPTGNSGTPASEKSFLYDKPFFPLKRAEQTRHLRRGEGKVDWSAQRRWGCAYRKSSPSILVMQSTQDRAVQNASRCLGGT
jgi:hypothetical protein